jgi:flagellar basal-body rod protein FlgC
MSEYFHGVMDVSGSALSAERQRMNLIANNIANASTTRGADGKPYKRKYAIFSTVLDKEIQASTSDSPVKEKGVRVDRVVTDDSPYVRVYDPNHPDADANGYVEYPNVNVLEEMVDLVAASRAYEANTTVMKITKGMLNKALEILRF